MADDLVKEIEKRKKEGIVETVSIHSNACDEIVDFVNDMKKEQNLRPAGTIRFQAEYSYEMMKGVVRMNYIDSKCKFVVVNEREFSKENAFDCFSTKESVGLHLLQKVPIEEINDEQKGECKGPR